VNTADIQTHLGSLSTVDWLLMAAVLVSCVMGLWRGFISELFSLGAWILALVLAPFFAAEAGKLVAPAAASDAIRYALGYLAVLVVVLLGGGLLSWLAQQLVQGVGLKPVDRLLGAVFGLLRGALIVLALAFVLAIAGMRQQTWWSESKVGPWADQGVRWLTPHLPQVLAKLLVKT
jgi:membrane protein required for colicin V production